MDWKTITSRFKIKIGAKLVTSSLDQKLVKSALPRALPKWPQLRHVGKFLSKKEKYILLSAALTIFAAGATLLNLFLANNIVSLPASGGAYNEALIGQPKYINPLFAGASDVDADIASLIYSGLFRFNDRRELEPDLTATYTIRDEGKIYEITLREDARWSDGEPLTASDVVYTFETIQNLEVESPLFPAFQGVAVKKNGNYGVKFTLKNPFAPFLGFLTVGILPEHLWNEVAPATMKLHKQNTQPAGSGPWMFDKLVKDENGRIQTYTLTRNEKYYKKKPYLNNITFTFFEDMAPAYNELRGRGISSLSFIPTDQREKISAKNFKLLPIFLPQYAALFFNQDKQALLKNNDLRQALAMSIDRQAIISKALQGQGEAVFSPILKDMLGYRPSGAAPTSSIEAANSLLDKKWTRLEPEKYFELRYKELAKERQDEFDAVRKNPSSTPKMVSSTIQELENSLKDEIRKEMSAEQVFYRKNKANELLRLTITTPDLEEYGRAAKLIGKMWTEIGAQVTIQPAVSRQIIKEVVKDRDYEILLYGEMVGNDPDPYPFWHSSQTDYPGMNLSLFVNRNADKLLEEARVTLDHGKRAEMYEKFQKILEEEIPAVFLYTPSHAWAVSKDVKGVGIQSIYSPSDRFAGSNNWYIKTKWKWK